jgi:hypothetical protein
VIFDFPKKCKSLHPVGNIPLIIANLFAIAIAKTLYFCETFVRFRQSFEKIRKWSVKGVGRQKCFKGSTTNISFL